MNTTRTLGGKPISIDKIPRIPTKRCFKLLTECFLTGGTPEFNMENTAGMEMYRYCFKQLYYEITEK